MCAEEAGDPAVVENDRQFSYANYVPASPPETLPPTELATAIEHLRQALANRKIEPICAAYRELHTLSEATPAGAIGEVLEKNLGALAKKVIVSAYSHRQCFMCPDGTVTCRQCRGEGQVEEGRRCTHCNGMGFTICGFCRGTGGADRDMIPGELKDAVLERQLAHVQMELPNLRIALSRLEQAVSVPPAQKEPAGRWLLSLQARLTDLAELAPLADSDQQVLFRSLAGEIETHLEKLRKA